MHDDMPAQRMVRCAYSDGGYAHPHIYSRGVWSAIEYPEGFAVVHTPSGTWLRATEASRQHADLRTSDDAIALVRALADADPAFASGAQFGLAIELGPVNAVREAWFAAHPEAWR